MANSVLYELDGHVATITYNRPDKLNAINGEMREDLNSAFSRFRDEEDAWIAIVTGAGRAFCAGADLRDGTNSAGDFPGTFWEKPTQNSFESGWEIFKPVIAAVNGPCIGYGLTLVTWCDFVIASDRAEFGFPEARIGVPTIVGAIRLPQRINWQYAMELLLTGERIDAARAKRSVSRVGWLRPTTSCRRRATWRSGCSPVRLSHNGPSRRWRCGRSSCRCSKRSGSAKQCGRSWRQPTMRAKACGPRPSADRRSGTRASGRTTTTHPRGL